MFDVVCNLAGDSSREAQCLHTELKPKRVPSHHQASCGYALVMLHPRCRTMRTESSLPSTLSDEADLVSRAPTLQLCTQQRGS